MKKIFILSLLLLAILLLSCKSIDSHYFQFTATAIDCTVNKKQALYYYEKYGMNNPKITVNYGTTKDPEKTSIIKKAFEVLSNVPEEYIEYTFKTYNIPVNIITYKARQEEYDGLSYYFDDKFPREPKEISYSTTSVLVHELGHMVHGIPEKKYANFSYDLTDLANDTPDIQKSLYLRLYTYGDQHPRDDETFAELFDTWYCSKTARDILKDQIPEAYALARKYLLPPIGETKDQPQKQSDSFFVEIKQNILSYQEINDIIENSKPSSTKCISSTQESIHTIKDESTGLIWTNIIRSYKTWFDASIYCRSLNTSNLIFRLPTFEELLNFYDHGCFNSKNTTLWTDSIPYIGDKNSIYTYTQNFNSTHSFKNTSKENRFLFLCVSDTVR